MACRLVIHAVMDDLGSEQVTHFSRQGPDPGVAVTPFLDTVVANGVKFTNYFGEPFCSPSRADHMTGRLTEDHGIGDIIEADNENPLLESELTLPEILKRHYGDAIRTAAFGKWHLGTSAVGGYMAPNLAGFDFFVGTERNINNYQSNGIIRQGERITFNGDIPGYITDCAIQWARRFAGDPRARRGYLYFPMHMPHEPFYRPPAGTYDDVTWHCADPAPPDQSSAPIVPYFKAMINYMDTLYARLWNSLPASLQAETILLISSDNGTAVISVQAETYPDGSDLPGGHAKRTNFDPGVRIPAYAYSPTLIQSPGRAVTGLVQVCDWYATTLELLGVSNWRDYVEQDGPKYGRPATERSISLVPNLVTGSSADVARTYVHTAIFTPNGFNAGTYNGRRMVTDGRYKLIYDGTRHSTANFYDIVQDPTEAAPITVLTGAQGTARTALLAERERHFDALGPPPTS